MNKRRTIYKGFNKRRKNKIIKVYIIGLGVFLSLICGYIQFKNSNILLFDKENKKIIVHTSTSASALEMI